MKVVKAVPPVSFHSGHRMVRGKVSIPSPCDQKRQKRKRVCMEKNSEAKQDMIAVVAEAWKWLEEEEDMQQAWEQMEEIVQKLQEEVAGEKLVKERGRKITTW